MWGDYGVAVCSADSNQQELEVCSDDSGGVIISWRNYRSSLPQVYAQRVNKIGIPLWTLNGLRVCPTNSSQGSAPFVSDNNGNAILQWSDNRNGNFDIYAQCLNSQGQLQWGDSGIVVCEYDSIQVAPRVCSDGQGGAIVCWVDRRNGNPDLYAQRVNSSGIILWSLAGVSICTADSIQWLQSIVSDGNSGAIICWQDKRSGDWDIYAQHIDSSGTVLWNTNGMAICTAPGLQERTCITSDMAGGTIIAWSDVRNPPAIRSMASGWVMRRCLFCLILGFRLLLIILEK